MAPLFDYRHLDPSARRIYRSTVLYGFEDKRRCYLLLVRNGYLLEKPPDWDVENKLWWMKGYHLRVLERYFTKITPLRVVLDAYT